MDKDLEYLDNVMSLKYKKDLYNNFFCWLYPFSNENISAYYSKLDFKDKTVLTVTSSGDHLLNAILLGAKEVDAFDMNPLAKYYSELKIAAIKSLSFEEFILFFYNKNIFKTSKFYLNKNIYYDKIRTNLNDDYKYFWDYVFNKYTIKQIKKSYLFSNDYSDLKILFKTNLYMSEDNYYVLKERLKNFKVNYYDKNIDELSSIHKIYDLVILSNIPAFVDEIFKSKKLEKLKDILLSIKHDDTVIVLNYYYDNMFRDSLNNSSIYDLNEVKKVFPDFEFIKFKSASNDRPLMSLFERMEDGVVLSKKR